MSNATPNRMGQQNATGDAKAIFLEVFSGLVLNKFDVKQITLDRQIMKTIMSGKSAQFPYIWNADTAYHTPGAEILGSEIQHNKKTISIEDLLYSDVFVDVLDEAMNHYETRAEYAHQVGEALANKWDSNSFRAIYKGAAAVHPIDSSGTYDGTALNVAAMSTDADVLKAALYDSAQTFDEADVPEGERYAAVRPLGYYLLLENGEFLQREFGGEGSQARATMPWAADLQVLKSNNIPNLDESGGIANVPDILEDDFRELVGVVWHKSAIGTVKLLDLSTESEYDIRRQGTLLVSKFAIGQDFLRTEACISLEDDNLV